MVNRQLSTPIFGVIKFSDRGKTHVQYMDFSLKLIHIKKFAEKIFGVGLFGRTRRKPYPEQRFITWSLAYDEHCFSLSGIGAYLGGYNHATVLSGIMKARDFCDVDKEFKENFELVRSEWERYKIQNSIVGKPKKRTHKNQNFRVWKQ